MTAEPLPIDQLLIRSREGDRGAFDALMPLVYEELRALAHRHRRRWTGGETLGTTALVHEAYVKLADAAGAKFFDRSHLLAVAARAMRQILVDYYRSQGRQKRGGRALHLSLDGAQEILELVPRLTPPQEEAVLALDDSLGRLALESERHARIVDCRYFGGLTIEETATALGISVAAVKRGAAVARAWLARDLGDRRPDAITDE